MSAWLCSDEHIFEMAHYYIEHCQKWSGGVMSFKDAAELLYNENLESLAARYGDEYPPIVVPQDYEPVVENIFHMAKMVGCYEYQSCEHDAWKESTAKEMCETILYYLMSNHPDYDAAPWGFERKEYVKKFVNKS